MESVWRVRVWNSQGTTWVHCRRGTYEQVRMSLAGLPAGYIWSID